MANKGKDNVDLRLKAELQIKLCLRGRTASTHCPHSCERSDSCDEERECQYPVANSLPVTEVGQNIKFYLEYKEESYCSVLSMDYEMKSVYLFILFKLTRISACKNNL